MEKKELIDEGNGLNPIEIRVGSNSDTIMVRPRGPTIRKWTRKMGSNMGPRRDQIEV